jgi:hypothetical protein
MLAKKRRKEEEKMQKARYALQAYRASNEGAEF